MCPTVYSTDGGVTYPAGRLSIGVDGNFTCAVALASGSYLSLSGISFVNT